MRISERVENILRASKEARNSDRELIIIYMQKFGMELTPAQIEKFRDMPSTETIRRIRQKIQEQGKYPADEDVNEARYKKFKETRSSINDQSVESLLEAQGFRVKEWGEY